MPHSIPPAQDPPQERAPDLGEPVFLPSSPDAPRRATLAAPASRGARLSGLRVYVDVPMRRNDRDPLCGARRVDSQQLLGSTRELLIEHNGEVYRLRQTRARKLILTK